MCYFGGIFTHTLNINLNSTICITHCMVHSYEQLSVDWILQAI